MKVALLIATLPVLFFAVGAGAAIGAIQLLATVAPAPTTIIEAVQLDRDRQVIRMVRQGISPDDPARLTSNFLHWSKGDTVTPLLIATVRGNTPLLQYLLSVGAKLHTPPNDEALCLAARYGHSAVARVLISRNAVWIPEGGCDEAGATPLDISRRQGHDGLSELLKRYGAEAPPRQSILPDGKRGMGMFLFGEA